MVSPRKGKGNAVEGRGRFKDFDAGEGWLGAVAYPFFSGAVNVVSFFYAQPAGRVFEVLIGILKGKTMLPFDAG